MSKITLKLSTVNRNSIGGWTVFYPVRNENVFTDNGLWPISRILCSEKHFDGNRKAEALSFAREKEQAYYQGDEKLLERIDQAFRTILEVIHDPERYVLLTEQVKFLADQINEYQGDRNHIWHMRHGGDFTILDFMPAAYWHFTNWCLDQQSLEYQALSALEKVFSAGITEEPEEGEPEHYPFQLLGETAMSYWDTH
jgi:hypothetical protein